MKQKTKIAVPIVDRANYGRLKPLLTELSKLPNVELQIMSTGTMPLDRFGRAELIVSGDGFEIASRTYVELEGSNPVTMAKSMGLSMIEVSTELQRLDPDFLLVIGDRYEALAATIAAAFLNISIIHIQGGEVSGSVDECTRHAISKYAHYHFPSTKRSAEYLKRMGENPSHIFHVGCPVADVVTAGMDRPTTRTFERGVGATIQPDQPYFLVIFHPDTFESEKSYEQVNELLMALNEIQHPTVWLWPNVDAGSDTIARRLRQYREQTNDSWLRLVKNFQPEEFQSVLTHARVAIGNSSSFVRDSSFTGTPVVLVGDRQYGRETSTNVVSVPCQKEAIGQATQKQMVAGRFPQSDLYGLPGTSKKIAEIVNTLKPISRKRLHYVELD